MNNYIKGAIQLATAGLLLVTVYHQNKTITKLKDELKVQPVVGGDIQKADVIDSLQTELFNEKTINGRYELSLEHLKEVNPKAAGEFEKFYEHETE